MGKHSAFLLFFVLIQTTSIGLAQQPPVRDPQAIALLQQALAAMGGARNTDSVATGTLTLAGGYQTPMRVLLKTKGTDKVRTELQTPRETTVRILNRGRAVVRRSEETRSLAATSTIVERVTHIPAYSIIAEHTDPALALQFEGTAQIGGRGVFVVAVGNAANPNPTVSAALVEQTKLRFFIDPGSGQVAKLEYNAYDENGTGQFQKIEIYFLDYRLVGGNAVPFRQEIYADGVRRSTLILETLTFNVGLSDSEFDLPTEVNNAR